jgi:hypothetical protein
LQRAAQNTDLPWVMFRGDRVTSSGSSADETEARAARQASGGGDALWFRLEGKAYLTQDKATLDRLEFKSLTILGTQEFLAQEQQKASGLVQELQNQQLRLQLELKNNLGAIQAQLPNADKLNSFEQLNSLRLELEKVRRGLDEMAAKLRQQEVAQLESSVAAQREAMLKEKLKESAQYNLTQIPADREQMLRDAVSSGRARPVQ